MPLSMFLPLRIAVPLFVALVFSALAIAHGLFSYQLLSADLQRDVTRHLRTVLGMMQSSANASYRQGDLQRIEADLAQVSLSRFVQRVVLVDETGAVLLGGGMQGIGKPVGGRYQPAVAAEVVAGGLSRIQACDGGSWLCGYFRVNRYETGPGTLRGEYGLLYLEYDLGKHRGVELDHLLFFMASLVLAILLAALLLWYFLHHVVTRRVDDLQYAAQMIADGDFSVRSRVNGRDELARLAEEINRMAGYIQQRQAQLEESERRYRLLFNNAADAMYVSQLNADGSPGRFVEVNDYACQMLGYSREALLEMTLTQVFEPQHAGNIFAWLQQLERDGHAVFDSVHRRSDGATVPVEVSAHRFAHDGHTLVLLIARSLTSRQQLEQELHRFRLALDMSDDQVLMFEDGSYRFIYANHGAESALGYDRVQLESLTPLDIAHRLERDWFEAQLDALRRGERALLRIETEFRTGDGAPLPVELSLQYVSFSGGAERFVLIARDITEQKRARQALASANRALRTLSSGNMVLVRSESEEQLLAGICRAVVQEGGYMLSWIGYAEERDGERLVVPRASDGVALDYLQHIQVKWDESDLGQGPVGQAIRLGEPHITADVQTDPDFAPWREQAIRRDYHSVIALPLRDGATVIGALAIYAGEADAFTGEEQKLLEELAADISFGIRSLRTRGENVVLQQGQHQAEERLRENLVETIMAMAAALEKRDPYTAGHQQRVAKLAVAIGEQLGLSADQVEGIRFGALIHDIGKIYIPSEILNRPGRLSDNEFNLIKSHPSVGYDIIKDVNFPWPVAKMVRQHHERLDGSGYPDGLKGDAILLEAKILAVADVVEAITSHRPYRPGLGMEKALAEIEKYQGQWYDPEVVAACTAVVGSGEWAWE
ncbi:MAG: HD domain-containing phosphohydrolase [Pseudomonadota bacterium]